tara:strand:- start:133 stop:396 length:264 start_codon:yes stop_codon:yes gene_type:complete
MFDKQYYIVEGEQLNKLVQLKHDLAIKKFDRKVKDVVSMDGKIWVWEKELEAFLDNKIWDADDLGLEIRKGEHGLPWNECSCNFYRG